MVLGNNFVSHRTFGNVWRYFQASQGVYATDIYIQYPAKTSFSSSSHPHVQPIGKPCEIYFENISGIPHQFQCYFSILCHHQLSPTLIHLLSQLVSPFLLVQMKILHISQSNPFRTHRNLQRLLVYLRMKFRAFTFLHSLFTFF